MGMAEVYEWPTVLSFPLTREKHPLAELTCWLCNRDDTDMTFTWGMDGRRVMAGIHAKCVKLLQESQARDKGLCICPNCTLPSKHLTEDPGSSCERCTWERPK